MRLGVLLVGLGIAMASLAAAPPPLALPHSSVIIDTPQGPVRFNVEVATDSASRERGLMYRTAMAPDAGMLFDFQDSHFRSFWMKNTILPLDMIFIRANGTISSVAPNAKPMSEDTITSVEPVRAVLEINGGRAAALHIEASEKVHTPILGDAAPKS